MSKEMKNVELSMTAHNTCRLFLKKEMIIENDDMRNLLDSISLWGGADWKDDTHIAWEFDVSLYNKLKKFQNKY